MLQYKKKTVLSGVDLSILLDILQYKYNNINISKQTLPIWINNCKIWAQFT